MNEETLYRIQLADGSTIDVENPGNRTTFEEIYIPFTEYAEIAARMTHFSDTNLANVTYLRKQPGAAEYSVCGYLPNRHLDRVEINGNIMLLVLAEKNPILTRIEELENQNEILSECIMEMSEIVYA